jgi:ABC-type sugar transport system substrate-binding protein
MRMLESMNELFRLDTVVWVCFPGEVVRTVNVGLTSARLAVGSGKRAAAVSQGPARFGSWLSVLRAVSLLKQ